MENIKRFSNRIANYIKFRPHYPKNIIQFLNDKIDFSPQSTVADIGSGTGISSELFLENGNKVYGVEPNKEMREAAEEIFHRRKNFTSVIGTAENTTLEKGSVNLIVAAQAFHWFDQVATKIEFQRIAHQDGYLVLMWNDWKLDNPLLKAYEQILKDYGTDYKKVNFRNVKESEIKSFYSPHSYIRHSIPHSQYFDFQGFKGRLLSSSFIPLEKDEKYEPMMERLQQIYNEYNVENKIRFDYNCVLYCGKIG